VSKELIELLKQDGFYNSADAAQMAKWNPYSQTEASAFFDPWWMFGIDRGFDVVIGNPPYKILTADDIYLKIYKDNYHVCHGGKVNLYKLFFEKGISLLRDGRILSYISPSNYLTSGDSIELRKILLNNQIVEIIDYEEADNVFKSVTQAVATIVLRKRNQNNYCFTYKKLKTVYSINKTDVLESNKYLIKGTNSIINKLARIELKFGELIDGWQGEINVSTKKKHFIREQKKGCLPLIRGNQIGAFRQIRPSEEFCPIAIATRKHYSKERIVIQEVANSGLMQRVKGTIMHNVLCGHTTNYLIPKQNSGITLKYLLGLINSKLMNYYFKFYNQTNHVPIGEIKNIPLVLADNNIQKKSSLLSIKSLPPKPPSQKPTQRRLNGKLTIELFRNLSF
jgi:hypothetical protein